MGERTRLVEGGIWPYQAVVDPSTTSGLKEGVAQTTGFFYITTIVIVVISISVALLELYFPIREIAFQEF